MPKSFFETFVIHNIHRSTHLTSTLESLLLSVYKEICMMYYMQYMNSTMFEVVKPCALVVKQSYTEFYIKFDNTIDYTRRLVLSAKCFMNADEVSG